MVFKMNRSKWKKMYVVFFYISMGYYLFALLVFIDEIFNFPQYLTTIYVAPVMFMIYYFLLSDHLDFTWKYRNDQRKNREIKAELKADKEIRADHAKQMRELENAKL